MSKESSLPPPPPRRRRATLGSAPFPPPPVTIRMNFVRTVPRNSMARSKYGKSPSGSNAPSPPSEGGQEWLWPPAVPREENKKHSLPQRRNKTVSLATGIGNATERITPLSVSANNSATNVNIRALREWAKMLHIDPAKYAALERVPAESAPDGSILCRRPSPPTVKDTRPQTQKAVARRVTVDTPVPRPPPPSCRLEDGRGRRVTVDRPVPSPPPPSCRLEDGRLRGGRTPVVVAATSPSYRVPPPMSPAVQAVIVREISKAVDEQLAQKMAARKKQASTNEDTACNLRSLSYPPRALVTTKSSRDDSGLSNRLLSRCYDSSPDVQAVVVREISKALGVAPASSTVAGMKKVSTDTDAASSLSLSCHPGTRLVTPSSPREDGGPSNSLPTCRNNVSDGTRATAKAPSSLRLQSINDAGYKKAIFPRNARAAYLPRAISPTPSSRGRARLRSQGPPSPPRWIKVPPNTDASSSISLDCPSCALLAPSSRESGGDSPTNSPPTCSYGSSNGTGAKTHSSLRLPPLNDAGSNKTLSPRNAQATHLPRARILPASSRGRTRSRSQDHLSPPPPPPRRKKVPTNAYAASSSNQSCPIDALLAPSSRESSGDSPFASPSTRSYGGSNGTEATASSSLRLPSLKDASSRKKSFASSKKNSFSADDLTTYLESSDDSLFASPSTRRHGGSNGTGATASSSLRSPSLKDSSSKKKSFASSKKNSFSADDLTTYLPQAYNLPTSTRGRASSRSQGRLWGGQRTMNIINEMYNYLDELEAKTIKASRERDSHSPADKNIGDSSTSSTISSLRSDGNSILNQVRNYLDELDANTTDYQITRGLQRTENQSVLAT